MALSNNGALDIEFRLSDLLNIKLEPNQNPIVFSEDYAISFAGIERWYPLDTCKGGNVLKKLKDLGLVTDKDVVRPKESTLNHLSIIHSKHFLDNINLVHVLEGLYSQQSKDGKQNGRFSDIASLSLLPSFVVNNKLLRPFRFQVGGSLLAAKLALDLGWSINLGGGFTHCYPLRSGGFSPYSDVTLAVTYLLKKVNRVMIIDLSAQQCNGPERSFLHNKRVHILDIYNRDIYPLDGFARRGISVRGELESNCSSHTYLEAIRTKLDCSLECFMPDFVLYIAGTDVLVNDPAGCMNVSEEAIIERDQLIFLKLRSRGIPVCMLLGGGFSRQAHHAIARSIDNLHNFGLVTISKSSEVEVVVEVEEEERFSGNKDKKLNKISSFSTNDLRLVENASREEATDHRTTTSDEPDDFYLGSEYQTKGIVHRSKTFVGSLMNWAGWNRPQTVYHTLSLSDSLEDVDTIEDQ